MKFLEMTGAKSRLCTFTIEKLGSLVLIQAHELFFCSQVSEPEKWGYAADWKKVLVYFFGTKQM